MMLVLLLTMVLAYATKDVCNVQSEELTEHGLRAKLQQLKENNIITKTLKHLKKLKHDKPILNFAKALKDMDLDKITEGWAEDILMKLLGKPIDKTIGKVVNICADEDSLCYGLGQDVTIDDLGLASAFTWFGASLLTKTNLKKGVPTYKDMIVPVAQEDQQCEAITQAWTGVYWCAIDEDKMKD